MTLNRNEKTTKARNRLQPSKHRLHNRKAVQHLAAMRHRIHNDRIDGSGREADIGDKEQSPNGFDDPGTAFQLFLPVGSNHRAEPGLGGGKLGDSGEVVVLVGASRKGLRCGAKRGERKIRLSAHVRAESGFGVFLGSFATGHGLG